jgi:hypothetical protein
LISGLPSFWLERGSLRGATKFNIQHGINDKSNEKHNKSSYLYVANAWLKRWGCLGLYSNYSEIIFVKGNGRIGHTMRNKINLPARGDGEEGASMVEGGKREFYSSK